MHRYQKWMSVGLLALTPGIAVAGALDSPQLKPGYGSATAGARTAKKTKADANQELAEKIAKSMRNAKLSGYDIDIDVREGVAILDGFVISSEQRKAATKAARSVPGVKAVNNRLRLAEPASKPRPEQSAVELPRTQSTSRAARQVGYQPGNDRPASVQQAAAYESAAVGTMGQMPSTPAGAPVYGPPMGQASHAMYNQPNLPDNAWPTYAQYPNYAAVSYPSQYSASAWPYIGPFYPYPQVPLGWRKVTLEWDDGLWNLNFRSRTDRWWWFLDPKNW
jgi:hypothetical protein